MKKAPLLVAADDELSDYYRRLPLGRGVRVVPPGTVMAYLQATTCDLVLLDAGSDPAAALDLLHRIKLSFPAVPVLFLAETGSEELAVTAFRLGARDYLRRPFDVVKLKARIDYLLDLRRKGAGRRTCGPLDEDLSGLPREQGRPLYTPPNILRVLAYIEQRLHEQLSLDALAREAGLSPQHFCRSFRKYQEMSPMRFVCYQRVRRAKRLLLRDDLNISAVAGKVGFGNLNNLTRWFRIFEGTTPSRYRSALHRSGDS
jgi:AraC-like DNA-binding protein